MLNANVPYFDLSIVGVDVDRLTSEFAVNYVVLVQEDQAFKDLFGPVFDYLLSGRVNFLAIPR